MQHYIIEYNEKKDFSDSKKYLDVLSNEYLCLEYIIENYKIFIFENKENTIYDIHKRAFCNSDVFFYEKGFSKHKDMPLTFNAVDKLNFKDNLLEDLDGTFLHINIIDNELTIRRNILSTISNFYAKDGATTYFTSNINLLFKSVEPIKNANFDAIEIASTFALWTFEERYKNIKTHTPTTTLKFNGKNVSELRQEIFNTSKVDKYEVARRIETLFSDLISHNITEVKLDITAGMDSRVNVALLDKVKTYNLNVYAHTGGKPGSIDRKIGKYISNYYNFENEYRVQAVKSEISANYFDSYKTRNEVYNLISYGGANRYRSIKNQKFSNRVYMTGHFGNVINKSDDNVTIERIIQMALPNINILNEATQRLVKNKIEKYVYNLFGKKVTYSNQDITELFLRVQKHNLINQLVNENEYIMFTPFGMDVFFRIYSQSSKQDKIDLVHHLEIGEIFSYELYNEIPFEELKGKDYTNNSKFVANENALYFDTASYDLQQAYYNSSRDKILKYVNANKIHLEEIVDFKQLTNMMKTELTRAQFFTTKNIIGYLMEEYNVNLDDDFYYPTLKSNSESPEIQEERYIQNKFNNELRFLNLKDNYYNFEHIIFEYNLIENPQNSDIYCRLGSNGELIKGIRTSKNYYYFTINNLNQNGLNNLEIIKDENVIDTARVYIKSCNRIYIDNLSISITNNKIKIHNFNHEIYKVLINGKELFIDEITDVDYENNTILKTSNIEMKIIYVSNGNYSFDIKELK